MFPVLLRVRFSCFRRVMGRMMEVALSDVCVVRGFLGVPRFVMPSRLRPRRR
jgi:hypothetical protein